MQSSSGGDGKILKHHWW